MIRKLEIEKFNIKQLADALVIIFPVETMRVSGKEPIEDSLKRVHEQLGLTD